MARKKSLIHSLVHFRDILEYHITNDTFKDAEINNVLKVTHDHVRLLAVVLAKKYENIKHHKYV